MSNNQAVLITYLKDILFSEVDITANVEMREHIFEMKDSENASLGFISLYDLKAYVHEHEDEAADYKVKNIDSDEWLGVFDHPFFQRRKPQLVSLNTLDPESDLEFFILKHGQKTGPYEKFELVSMLEEKEILLTDMVSFNAGHTWLKLYQVENFDRRVLKESDQLPGVPTSVIAKPNESVTTLGPVTEAITSLAYLSNVKRGKTIEREKVEVYQADVNFKSGQSSMYKWLLVASLIGIGFFLYTIKGQLMSPFKPSSNGIGEQSAPMLTPVEMGDPMAPHTNPSARSQIGERSGLNQINNQNRNGGKFESRPMQPIRPVTRKSFMDTSKYQAIKGPNAPGEEDPNYFYDNTGAMELDPVRAQVSKENYDDGGASAEGPIPSNDRLFDSEMNN
ncbi:MAG: hypothetical protein H7336_00290 [Bacteriovorax sp.]|nr:hypothetical protein [Bacteriovorax sp.]